MNKKGIMETLNQTIGEQTTFNNYTNDLMMKSKSIAARATDIYREKDDAVSAEDMTSLIAILNHQVIFLDSVVDLIDKLLEQEQRILMLKSHVESEELKRRIGLLLGLFNQVRPMIVMCTRLAEAQLTAVNNQNLRKFLVLYGDEKRVLGKIDKICRGIDNIELQTAEIEHNESASNYFLMFGLAHNPIARYALAAIVLISLTFPSLTHANPKVTKAVVMQKHKFKSLGIKKEDHYVLKHTKGIAALVKLGFISNDAEALEMNTTDFHKKAGQGICYGILSYINKYKISQPMITIFPGHGSGDSGEINTTATNKPIVEHDIAMAVASQLESELRSRSINAMTITPRGITETTRLKNRVEDANKQGANIVVSLHCDATADRSISGTGISFNDEHSQVLADYILRYLLDRVN